MIILSRLHTACAIYMCDYSAKIYFRAFALLFVVLEINKRAKKYLRAIYVGAKKVAHKITSGIIRSNSF